MANASLYMDVIARDQASGVFNKIGHSASAMGTSVDKAAKAHRAFGAAKRILTGLATGYAGVKVVQFAKDSIRASSDLNESLTATNKVFKAQRGEIKAWATDAAQNFGQSKTQALSAAKQFGTLFTSAGMGGPKLANASKQMVQLASDMASFNNVDPAQALQDLTSGLTGQSEPLRKYGVFLSDAKLKQTALKMGIYEGTGALTDQQRTLAAQQEILKQTGVTSDKFVKQTGDFADTQAGFANQTRILAANWENVKAAAGKALLPLATSITKSLNSALPAITRSLNKGDLGNSLKNLAPKVEGFFKSFSTNLPAFKSIGSDLGTAASQIGRAVSGVFDVFTSLPKGVQQGIITIGTAALAMKALNRAAGGGGMTGFAAAVESIPHAVAKSALSTAAAESVKAVFGNRFGRMVITAGVVYVNGGKMGGPGGVGGKPGKGGVPSVASLGGLAGLGIAGLATAFGVAFGNAIYQSISGNAQRDLQRTGGNPTQFSGSPDRAPRPQAEVWNDKGTGMSYRSREVLGRTYRANDAREAARASDAAAAAEQRHRKAVIETYKAQDRAQASDKNRRAGLNDVGKASDEASRKSRNLGAAIGTLKSKKLSVTEDGANQAKTRVRGLGGAVGALRGKRVRVDEDGANQAKGRVRGLDGQIKGLRGKQVKVDADPKQAKFNLGGVLDTIARIPRTVPVNVQVKRLGGAINVGGKPYAAGGSIVGPGSGTSDSIPAMLSNGEYVIQASAVKKYGVAFLDRVNSGQLAALAKGRFPSPPKKPGKGASDKAKTAYQNKLSKYQNSPYYEARQAEKAANQTYNLAKAIKQYNVKDPQIIDYLTSMSPTAAVKILKDPKRRKNLKTMAQKYASMTPADTSGSSTDTGGGGDTSGTDTGSGATDTPVEPDYTIRDAINSAADAYRSFASIATTAVTSVDDAQSKLADTNQEIIDAQKAMEIAGSDRERALASVRLTKALEAQAQAQKDLANAGKPTSATITANMGSKLAKLRSFAGHIVQLRDSGLDSQTLSDILAMGPEQGDDFASALLAGGIGAINEVSSLQSQIRGVSADLGLTTYNASLSATEAANAAATAVQGGARSIQIAPAPVTVSIDGNAIAKALISFKRQNGGSIPGLAV